MDPQKLQAWMGVIGAAVELGVRSWHVIDNLLSDAGVDADTIEQLKAKWEGLASDVQAAASRES